MARLLLVKAEGLSRLNYAVTPPLGLLYIAAVLRRDRGHEVRILDLRVAPGGYGELARVVREFRPHIVGISAVTMEAPSLHRAALTVKGARKDVPVIAGGPHPTAYPREVLSDPSIDRIVLGEGESTILGLSDDLLDGNASSAVPGSARVRDGEYILGPPRPPVPDLDSLPFPAWDLLDLEPYSRVRGMASLGLRRYMTLYTSRACPYRCIYCHNIFGKEFRARSPQNVLEEIRYLMKAYNNTDFEVLDDIFNLDAARAKEIFRNAACLGARFSFPNGLRTDLLDEELLGLMKDGGTTYVSIAVETASPRLQKLIRKNLNLDKVRSAIELCSRLRIFTRGFFMLGFPTETHEEMRRTISFACSSSLHTAMFFIVTPFQGTELESMYRDRLAGDRTHFRDYDYFTTPFNLSEVGSKDLFRLQRTATLKFFFSPTRIARILRDYPRRKYLWYHGLRVLTGFFQYFKRGN